MKNFTIGGRRMSICPFWSSGNKKFECYSKCPMHKENTNEECIFSLYLVGEHKKKNKKSIAIDDIDSYIDFKEIEEDILTDIIYIKKY